MGSNPTRVINSRFCFSQNRGKRTVLAEQRSARHPVTVKIVGSNPIEDVKSLSIAMIGAKTRVEVSRNGKRIQCRFGGLMGKAASFKHL